MRKVLFWAVLAAMSAVFSGSFDDPPTRAQHSPADQIVQHDPSFAE